MSGLISGLVWELPISLEFTREKKYILLAYADHADQNGRNIFPSVDLIASKTGYSERSVQYITNDLVRIGMMVEEGVGPRGTNKYRIPLIRDAERGAKIAPLAPESIAPESIAPEPSLVVKDLKEEEEGKTTFEFSEKLSGELEKAGVYRSSWPMIQKRLGDGWAEADVMAILAWVKSSMGSIGRVVARIREGTKAPPEYYPLVFAEQEPGEDDHPGPFPGEEISEIDRTWSSILEQLIIDMPRASFETWVEDTRPVAIEEGYLVVGAHDAYARDWLENRLESTVNRILVGVTNTEIKVKFVVCEEAVA